MQEFQALLANPALIQQASPSIIKTYMILYPFSHFGYLVWAKWVQQNDPDYFTEALHTAAIMCPDRSELQSFLQLTDFSQFQSLEASMKSISQLSVKKDTKSIPSNPTSAPEPKQVLQPIVTESILKREEPVSSTETENSSQTDKSDLIQENTQIILEAEKSQPDNIEKQVEDLAIIEAKKLAELDAQIERDRIQAEIEASKRTEIPKEKTSLSSIEIEKQRVEEMYLSAKAEQSKDTIAFEQTTEQLQTEQPKSLAEFLKQRKQSGNSENQPISTPKQIKPNTEDKIESTNFEPPLPKTGIVASENELKELQFALQDLRKMKRPVMFNETAQVNSKPEDKPSNTPTSNSQSTNSTESEPKTEVQPRIITESMAKIYIIQGKYTEALAVYTKLMEQNPEKSVYFALQIQKLQK